MNFEVPFGLPPRQGWACLCFWCRGMVGGFITYRVTYCFGLRVGFVAFGDWRLPCFGDGVNLRFWLFMALGCFHLELRVKGLVPGQALLTFASLLYVEYRFLVGPGLVCCWIVCLWVGGGVRLLAVLGTLFSHCLGVLLDFDLGVGSFDGCSCYVGVLVFDCCALRMVSCMWIGDDSVPFSKLAESSATPFRGLSPILESHLPQPVPRWLPWCLGSILSISRLRA